MASARAMAPRPRARPQLSADEAAERADMLLGHRMHGPRWLTYPVAAAFVTIVVPLGWLIQLIVSPAAVPLAFLAAVLAAAMVGGVGEALFASLVSYGAYAMFFGEPLMSFAIHDSREAVTIAYFLVFSVTVGLLAARLRHQLAVANLSAERAYLLYNFARQASAASTEQQTAEIIVGFVARSVNSSAALFGREEGQDLHIIAASPPEVRLDVAAQDAALWAIRYRTSAGWSTRSFPEAAWLFIPLAPESGKTTLLAIARGMHASSITPSERQLIDTLADQSLVLTQRARLMAETVEAQKYLETERLRSALLSSVSHDLRTPLATIIGASTTLESLGDRLTPENRVALASSIADESRRLNRYIQNLLDMSRLGHSALRAEAELIDLRDVIASARERTRDSLADHRVAVHVPDDAAFVMADDTLLEQVLVNILDNAGKYGVPGGRVEIAAARRGDMMAITVSDDGVGIEAADRQRIFDPFFRLADEAGAMGDCGPAGSGLGLSIARGFARAMGGDVQARDPAQSRGARFEITIPAASIPVLDGDDDADGRRQDPDVR